MSFDDIADERRMTRAKGHFGELTWDIEPDGLQRMKLPSAATVEGALRLMQRRGLEPALVGTLLSKFPARPIERALIAYDVLRDCLLGTNDGAFAERAAEAVQPLHGIATELAAVPRDRIGSLIEAVRPSIDDIAIASVRADFTTLPSLAGLVYMASIRYDVAADDAMREGIFAHVRTLAVSHLPSLAIAFCQILWDRFALPFAREMMVELALDADLLASVPEMPGTDAESMQLQTYLLVRAALAQFDTAGAAKILAAMEQHPAVADASNPSLTLVEAHLAVMQGQRLDDAGEAQVSQIANAAGGWRYARLVADAVAAPVDPERIAARLDSYLTTFGNDAGAWAQPAMHDDARPALLALLSRELRLGAHAPSSWRALASLVDGASDIETESSGHIASQLTRAVRRQ